MAGRAMVIFCRRHIGIPQERSAGEWLHSVTTPHELLPLLGRIFHVALASAENSPALMAPEAQAGNNDDMMILVVDDHPINRRLLADQLEFARLPVRDRERRDRRAQRPQQAAHRYRAQRRQHA